MTDSEDHNALAAEYVLGTLDASERAQVEATMSADKDFAAMVEAWERRLNTLSQMVGPVEPRPEVWEKIRAEVSQLAASSEQEQPLAFPSFDRADTHDDATLAALNVVAFRGRVQRWRNVAAITSAIAAALVAVVATQVYRPDLLPEGLRPKQQVQVVQSQMPAGAQYVAVLQKDGNSPAFILTVDDATKRFTVRKVGAQQEAGKSYELWIVSDKLQAPRSLGVIGGDEFTARPILSAFDADTINQATYAVTAEPEGGSPTGAPTGPIVFTGKLVESVPGAQPSPTK
jgi:anti-sigma-K factor RskA